MNENRKPLIAGNWKMNLTAEKGTRLIESLKPMVKDASCDIAACVPAILIPAVSEAVKGSNIRLGAQNMHWETNGAYTGEIDAEQLKEYGVEYVIVGHSERRSLFGDTDETVNRRARAVLRHGLIPIICVGETLEQRGKDLTNVVLNYQIEYALHHLYHDGDVRNIVVAYEPIWAIGTGVTATNEQAEETIAHIRRHIARIYSQEEANAIRILYGGSMNRKNCKGLMAQANIDGGLIGGASLNMDFASIVNFDK